MSISPGAPRNGGVQTTSPAEVHLRRDKRYAAADGAPVVFEFSTTTGALSVQARVIHCHEVDLSGWPSYEIGCRFAHALPGFAQDLSDTSASDLLDPPSQSLSGREPLWREHMIAGCCELAAGVWLTVTLVLVLADWAAKLLST